MKKHLFIFIFFIAFSITNAQHIDIDNYRPLQSAGKMPDDISRHFFEHLQTRKDEIKNDDSYIKRYSSDFALKSSYYLNQILKSGKLLYGDPLSDYVNTVADIVLQKHPEIRQKIRFYVIRHPIVNAFALDPGVIIVTTGLLAQIENEAQLAFVLAHEIIHIEKKHSIDLFLTQKKLSESKEDNGTSMVDSRIFKYHYRSREHENEADKLGVSLFLADSPYDIYIVDGIFDVLQFGHLPFNENPGFIESFQNEHFIFPDKLVLKDINPINISDSIDDTLSTHPNIKNRRQYMNDHIVQFNNGEKKKFVQDESLFYKIRDLARFEVINSQLLSHNYLEAAYNAFILKEYLPQNPFLKKTIVTALYGASKYKSNAYGSLLTADYRNKEGNLHQIFHFFRKISKLELNILALREAWEILCLFPNDTYLKNITADLMTDLKSQKIKTDDFIFVINDSTPEIILKDTVTISDRKYDRIKDTAAKKSTAPSKLTGDMAYLKYALTNLTNSEKFIQEYNNLSLPEELNHYSTNSERKKTNRLNIEKILVFNPYYIKIDERKKSAFRIITSMEKEIEITNKAQNISEKIKLDSDFISSHKFSEGDTDFYNEFCLISDWLDEFYAIDGNFCMHIYHNQYLSKLKEEHNTKYVNLIVFATIVRKKSFSEYRSLFFYSFPIVTLPFTVYAAFKPSYTSFYKSTLVDMENAQVLYSESQYFNFNSRKDQVNIRLYDSFNTIRKPKK